MPHPCQNKILSILNYWYTIVHTRVGADKQSSRNNICSRLEIIELNRGCACGGRVVRVWEKKVNSICRTHWSFSAGCHTIFCSLHSLRFSQNFPLKHNLLPTRKFQKCFWIDSFRLKWTRKCARRISVIEMFIAENRINRQAIRFLSWKYIYFDFLMFSLALLVPWMNIPYFHFYRVCCYYALVHVKSTPSATTGH